MSQQAADSSFPQAVPSSSSAPIPMRSHSRDSTVDDDGAAAGESELNTIEMNLSSPAHYAQQGSSYSRTQLGHVHTPTHSVIDEDSTNRFFMSEPSISEDGDASSGQVVRAPHRALIFGRHHSSDEDEQRHRSRRHNYRSHRRRHGNRSPYRSAPSSPGNTSLSSWDSPAPGKVKNLIQFHFVPPTLPSAGDPVTGRPLEGTAQYPLARSSLSAPANPSDSDRKLPPMPSSSNRTTPLGEEGEPDPWKEEEDADSYFLRQLHYATSASERPKEAWHDSLVLRTVDTRNGTADESIAMTLSDSENEEEDAGNDADASAHWDWSLQGSADNNSTANKDTLLKQRQSTVVTQRYNSSTTRQQRSMQQLQQQQQRPIKAISHPPSQTQYTAAPVSFSKAHKRSRSGDAAAAKLATGRQEWKGMSHGKMFSPLEDDDGDDEKDDIPPHPHKSRKAEAMARRNYKNQQHQRLIAPSSSTHRQHQQQLVLRPNGPPLPHLSADPSVEKDTLIKSSRSFDHATYGSLSNQQKDLVSNSPLAPIPSWPPKMLQLPASSWNGPPIFPRDHAGVATTSTYKKSRPRGLFESGSDSGGDADDDYAFSYDGSQYTDRSQRREGHVHFAPTTNQSVDEENPAYKDHKAPEKLKANDAALSNMGQRPVEKAKRALFLPQTSFIDEDGKKYHFYTCPNCKTRQREFFTVNTAPQQLEGPGSYLALYFSIYVIASLFIFGLEEGWEAGDCIYFAVVTLTTAGLGDFVPTSSANKLICSIFIYFGVACIGLLLGTYIAGMLDDKARRDRKTKLIESCPNCARLQTMKEASCRSALHYSIVSPLLTKERSSLLNYSSERTSDARYGRTASQGTEPRLQTSISKQRKGDGLGNQVVMDSSVPYGARGSATDVSPSSNSQSSFVDGSPAANSILDRQGHTRHDSIDYGGTVAAGLGTPLVRRLSHDNIQTPTIVEGIPLEQATVQRNSEWEDESSSETESVSTTEEIVDEAVSKMKAIQYVFLTLRQALVNSMVIIAVGCFGFWFIEGFSVIDSWYFTTVFLTTVGYGDIVPVTRGGKLFATVYILVAGTILLNNMSSISMIPIELRKRRLERAVLTQFGDELDDAALRELATGPLIQRLRLSANRPDGLDECTREMFSLAMLVRLGKVSETDIRETFAAFRRLDVNNEGILNSKSIIAAIIQKRTGINASTSMCNLQEAAARSSSGTRPSSNNSADERRSVYWLGRQGSLHVETPAGEYTFEDAESLSRRERQPLQSAAEMHI